MSFKFGSSNRKDRVAARFVSQVHAVLARAAIEAKREHKRTQADVARELDVDRSTISRLLAGAGNPTARTIGELAGVLGYRPVLIFQKVEHRPHSNHPRVTSGGKVPMVSQNPGIAETSASVLPLDDCSNPPLSTFSWAEL